MKNIQTNLLSAFESSGLTYDELARRTNLPKSALYRYINGDTEKIPIDRFQAICAELHVDAGTLLGWTDDHPDDPVHDHPVTSEARILAKGIDRLPQEEREQALAVVRAMFTKYADYFDKENNDDSEL
jgi:transcriptional regulator with XRE-family HTH domain